MHDRIRRLTLINSVIGISIAGISTRVFVFSVPTLAAALGTDILGISWALIVYQMAGIGLGGVRSPGRHPRPSQDLRLWHGRDGRWLAALRAFTGRLSIDPVSIRARRWRCDDSVFRPYLGL